MCCWKRVFAMTSAFSWEHCLFHWPPNLLAIWAFKTIFLSKPQFAHRQTKVYFLWGGSYFLWGHHKYKTRWYIKKTDLGKPIEGTQHMLIILYFETIAYIILSYELKLKVLVIQPCPTLPSQGLYPTRLLCP